MRGIFSIHDNVGHRTTFYIIVGNYPVRRGVRKNGKIMVAYEMRKIFERKRIACNGFILKALLTRKAHILAQKTWVRILWLVLKVLMFCFHKYNSGAIKESKNLFCFSQPFN